ncbi:ceramide transfer protein-like isoform X5 [Amphibalanus amphitrite]|uniref:ceramide transfer protein-like isoform X5 n=2 Tax=Amphibalanus amphitrite TaxID=1232801 RepID=UPI001C91D4D6|nr:ceramide transfer protein-like isoform X5 [Amphibalanus amphitrite]
MRVVCVVSFATMDDPTINLSDEDEEMEQQNAPLAYEGSLSKWTNYIHGWQSRWMVLSNGTLSYYKSEHEQGVGCRGAISVFKAVIKPHEFDECRFDVCVGDSVWYLRSNALDDRNRWMEAIERAKCADSAYGSANSLKRHGSALSLTSNTLSGSGVKWCKGLREKVEELETFRDILTRQVDTMQNYFDACISVTDAGRGHGVGHPAWSDSDDDALPTETRGDAAKAPPTPSREAFQAQGLDPIDFKGEAITFKATTSGVLSTLQHCAELMAQREDAWRRRMERELERRRQLEELLARQQEAAALAAGAGTPPPSSPASAGSKQRHIMFGGPDYQEGPHSTIGEDEFFDAVESALDRITEDQEFRDKMRKKQSVKPSEAPKSSQHSLLKEVERVTQQQFKYALAGVDDGVWTIFAEEGEMKMYKREEEVDGLAVDPLKAVHFVSGVTAHEVCHHFWSPDVRLEWETTVEQVTILETVDEQTAINLQVHKRVWPAAQRDSLFWSHIERQVVDGQEYWVVVNNSTDYASEAARESSDKYVRVLLTVCMTCQTEIVGDKSDLSKVTRDQLRCKITYCSVVNPGGWAPTSALRMVYKREYPRFLKRFTGYVIEQCKNKPIQW